MKRTPKGRLELTWMGKDSALIPVEDGKYDYSFVDPDDPRALEVKSIEVLEQVGEVEGPTGANENLLIIGDSGDALRSLGTIPEYHDKYAGQVKLVYIDPPFNTEQTFEHYADQLEHSIWLTMMRDRIRDIKPLLAPDASIWVHLDDAEVHRMRVLMDEEFGAENFITSIAWEKRYSRSNDAVFSSSHDTLLVYGPNPNWQRSARLVRLSDPQYRNPDNDPRGPWRGIPWDAPNIRPNLTYPIEGPDGTMHMPPPGRCWSSTRESWDAIVREGRAYFGVSGKAKPNVKRYLSEMPGLVPNTFWPHEETGHNDEAKKEVQRLFPGVVPFATPKPERLLERIIHLASTEGDLVLDFFAGSGSSLAVSHKMKRRWLGVELQKSTVEKFVSPRLRLVVMGNDPGGITSKTSRQPAGDLPEGMNPHEAQQFSAFLTRVAKSVKGLDSETLKSLRAATKTKTQTTVQWEGGGGFTVAKMGPSMYEVDDEDGTVFLSPEATNGAWSKAIAGQLKFALTPDDPVFCGVRKRQRLAVIDGVADETVVRTVVEHLGEKEKAVIVAKGVLPEAADLLQRLSPGSRIKKAPEDMFPKGTVN